MKPKAASSTKQRSVQRHEARTKRPDGYFYAVGRRKAAIAQVKLWPEQKKLEVKVNGKELKDYFGARFELLDQVIAPLVATGLNESVKIEAKVSGGGLRGQAEAIRLGVARTLLLINPEYRLSIKKLGYLMRDPRVKERKKPGLKKARRAPQWSKR